MGSLLAAAMAGICFKRKMYGFLVVFSFFENSVSIHDVCCYQK